MSKTLILKVLSGSQLGVEIGLPDGEYTFGSGPEADIQFSDLSMAPVHGQLRLAGGKVEIRATGAALQTASGLVIAAGDGDWREIAQLDRVTAGTSVFAVGGADANWTSLANTPAPVVERRPEPSKPVQINRNWLIGGGVVAACLVAVFLLTGGDGSSTDGEKLTGNETATLVRSALSDLPFANDLAVGVEADGAITVSGYVETATERRAVQNILEDLGIDVRRRIWALEALRTDVSGLIESQNIDVTATLKPDGELVLSGVWLDKDAVDHTVELLQTEVFGLSKITNDIQTAADFLEDTQALIAKVQLADLVLARQDGDLIETTGVVPQDKMDNWVGFMRAYARQIAPHMALRSFVTLEGQPADAAVPVIIGGEDAAGVDGRVLPVDTVETETTDPASLFANSDTTGTAAPAPAPATGDAAATEAAPDPNLDAYEEMIAEFARQNPEVAATLIRSLTNGQFSDIEGLREFFASGAGTTEEAALTTGAPAGATVSNPDAIVDLLNSEDETTTDGTAEPAAQPAVASAIDPAMVVDRLNEALALLFDTSGETPVLTESAKAENPELSAVSKELIALANAQRDALAQGQTLLDPATPLGAERETAEITGDRCWPGSHITVQSLPTVLLWMDILSLSTNLEISEVRPDSRVMFMEAALNPDRIRHCLTTVGGDFGTSLLNSSEFLRETARNDSFASFLFRNMSRYPLDLAGINLTGARYAQLSDGRKLGEGSAPGVDSRLVVIGDLGLLIRVADGYRVNLYGDRIGWMVSGM